MFIFDCVMVYIFNFLGVGFFVLLERSILGYIQVRKGPEKLMFFGVFQPFSDALSLFSKESYYIYFGNLFIYYVVPVFGLVASCMVWVLYPLLVNMISLNLGLLYFLACSGTGVFFIILAGWSSNSVYPLIGSVRAVAQIISYEVCMFLIVLSLLFFTLSLSMLDFFFIQKFIWLMYVFFPLFLIFMSCILAETNRSPFDFAEGESELVSGFNLEYSSFSFSFFFLSEYLSMIFMSFLGSMMFLGGNYFSSFFFLSVYFLMYMFVWVRGSFPRFRYDSLMYLSWKCFLPLALNYFFFFFFFFVYLMFFINLSSS